ncbi:MAG: HAD-IIIC family phosphatase, partial [Kiritimatiellae bacterium]|nr:HAD-IIIC family phosphatase [Kiritimatiellia bacterium]
MRIAFAGDVTMDFFARDAAREGHETYIVPGFGAWRQEFLAKESGIRAFKPDAVLCIDLRRDEWSAKALAALPFRVILPPVDALAQETEGFYDPRMEKIAGFPFALAGLAAVEEEFAVALAAGTNPHRWKLLALDADNTLWRGIASEGAVEENAELQKYALELKNRGVLLALLSKNDFATVAETLNGMTLSTTDFVFPALGVNWSEKCANLLEICRRLNIGADSAVFVDDRAIERERMKSICPALDCNASTIRRLETYFFPAHATTAEDALRQSDYAAQEERAHLQQSLASREDFLKSLHQRFTAARATAEDVPRLAQMAGKTNQFNATTIRRSENDFKRLLADANARVWTFRASDRFGDMGLVCYIVAQGGRITDFVMSCRAMGRTLEDFALRFVKDALDAERIAFAGIDF